MQHCRWSDHRRRYCPEATRTDEHVDLGQLTLQLSRVTLRHATGDDQTPILVLFEPLREKIKRYIHRAFFRERVDLEQATTRTRRQLNHMLKVEEMLHVVMSTLEASHRTTTAALYLRHPSGH